MEKRVIKRAFFLIVGILLSYFLLHNFDLRSMTSPANAKGFIIWGFLFGIYGGLVAVVSNPSILLLAPFGAVFSGKIVEFLILFFAFLIAIAISRLEQRNFIKPNIRRAVKAFMGLFFTVFLILSAVNFIVQNHIEEKINITLPDPIKSVIKNQMAPSLPCAMNETFQSCAEKIVDRQIKERCGNDIQCIILLENSKDALVRQTAANLARELNATPTEKVEVALDNLIESQFRSILEKIGLKRIIALFTLGYVFLIMWIMGLLAIPAGIVASLLLLILEKAKLLERVEKTVKATRYEV